MEGKKRKELQKKWDKIWADKKIYNPNLDEAKDPFYSLYMFPYPSAEGLHVGHAFSATGADVYSRFKRMNGKDVLHPMGFDAFGIHSENYALKINDHPKDLIERTTKKFREQFDSLGISYDWEHSVNTSDPSYYRWTQWLFIQLFKAGLAEKKKAEVNWCPSCKTVLADEQVISGECERCGSVVERKELEQWFFNITKYSERLLLDLDKIDWSEKVKLAQKNWIGKSEGATIKFKVQGENDEIEVFTTRPETLHGATFLALAYDHPFVIKKAKDMPQEVKSYIDAQSKEKPSKDRSEKPKTGVFSGLYAVNPSSNEKLPIYIASYVLAEYGTGAIMGVPAHDQRDFDFAKKYEIAIKQVLGHAQQAEGDVECYDGQGKIINSGEWDGWDSEKDFHRVISWLEDKHIGTKETRFHLRDWLISRQRYWGAPIPMVFCEKCGWQAVPEDELPVMLPYVKDFRPLGTGVSPLAQDEEFVKAKCTNCGGKARREVDVCDTFLDSSWYFLRYPSADFSNEPFDQERTKKWLPVDMYIGGAEHSVLHLLYARFITKALFDLKLLEFDEPFTKFRAHGLLIKEGAKMSKSRGNVINPDEYVAKFGADVLRLYLMFLGPYEQGGDFRDSGIEGMDRFLKRVERMVKNHSEEPSASFLKDKNLDRKLGQTIKKVTGDVESLHFNTAIASIMELVNDLNRSNGVLGPDYLKPLILMLAPFAPYACEELWATLSQGESSVHLASWPTYNENDLANETAVIAVQVNGKLRGMLEVEASEAKDQKIIQEKAISQSHIGGYLEGKDIVKTIYIEAKVLNFVVK